MTALLIQHGSVLSVSHAHFFCPAYIRLDLNLFVDPMEINISYQTRFTNVNIICSFVMQTLLFHANYYTFKV